MLPRLCKCVANLLILEYILHITSDNLIFVLFFRGELNTNNNATISTISSRSRLACYFRYLFFSILSSHLFRLIILSFFLLWDYLLRYNFFSNFLSHFFTFINTYVIIIHENILISTEYPVYRIKDNPRKQPTPILFASDGGQTCRQREMVTDTLSYNLRWNLMREFGVRLYATYMWSHACIRMCICKP